MRLKELLAKTLFQDKFRLRKWESSKPWAKAICVQRAEEALKRSGVKDRDLGEEKDGEQKGSV